MGKEMKYIKDILFYLVTLFLSVYGAVFFLVNGYIKGKWQFLFIFCYFEFMQLLWYYLVKKMPYKIKKTQFGLCLLLSCITAFLLLNAMEINFPRQRATVVIGATGEKNDSSMGNEIRLENILIDGEKVELETIWHDSIWTYDSDNTCLVATPLEQSSSIQFSCEKARKIEIEFLASEYSGIVEIRDDEGYNRLDLYEEDMSIKQYEIKLPTETTLFWRCYSYISSIILFLLIYYSFMLYMYRKRVSQNRI